MVQYNFPIKQCPNCGSRIIEIIQKISGHGSYYVDLVTGETEMSELHSGLTYENAYKHVKCAKCGKKLFKVDNELNVIQ